MTSAVPKVKDGDDVAAILEDTTVADHDSSGSELQRDEGIKAKNEDEALLSIRDSEGVKHPETLDEWRRQINRPESAHPGDILIPLEAFFLSQGYTLWKPRALSLNLDPPTKSRVRQMVLPTALCTMKFLPDIPLARGSNSIHCPARTADNRDVLTRLMSISQDRGERHLAALSRLATGEAALRGDNPVVPVLQEIVHEDMKFMVFPLMATCFDNPWFYRFSEVLDVVQQILEGIKFCHERLVAHLDLDSDNFLVNWVGGARQHPDAWTPRKLYPFRRLFPIRYYLNDFEFACTFDQDSEPSSRVVTGLPITGIRTGKYGRDVAPEMLSGEPYCPFRTDIWQLGTMFKLYFGHLGHLSPGLVDLINEMCSEDPALRPSAAVALDRVEELDISRQALTSEVPYSGALAAQIAALAADLNAELARKSKVG